MNKKKRQKLDDYYRIKYGISLLSYERKWEEQGKCCALCKRKKKPKQRRFALDHNHKTGVIRGIVCYYCNKWRISRHDYLSARNLFNYMIRYEF